MNDLESVDLQILLAVLIFLAFVVSGIAFLITQVRTLEKIRQENQRIFPPKVWLQLIPVYGHVWQFFVISRIADSIRDELTSPIGDAIFSEDTVASNARPTFFIGIAYAICFCVGLLPIDLLQGPASLIGIVCWIIYWIQLAKYKKKLKARSMLLNA
jgi:hypothetical protein